MSAHNTAKKGDIAKTVFCPGDPLRAQYIAENYLEGAKCFNTVRNMLGFTGTYKGKEVSVMGTGMGMPSIGIYTYELFHEYDVDRIIRIGSTGALADDLNMGDVVVAQGCCTDSNFAYQYNLPGTFAPIGSFNLIEKVVAAARANNINIRVGNVVSSDVFYNIDPTVAEKWLSMGALCVEMETAALYMNAAYAKKEALGIFTVSDHLFKEQYMSPEERQTSFHDMFTIALESMLQ